MSNYRVTNKALKYGLALLFVLTGPFRDGSGATSASSVTESSQTAGPGTTYYVSNSGSDSNLGTSTSSAWKTIAKVQSFLGNLQPGDSVLFQRGGIWNEQLDLANVNGSSAFPVTLGNYGFGSLPVIDGGSIRDFCIDAIGTSVLYLVIDGFECRNATTAGVVFITTNGGMPGIVVRNSYIHNTGPGACAGCGVPYDDGGYKSQLMFADWRQGANGVQFLNNVVNNCGGHNCVQIHYDTGNPVIQGNIVGPGCVHNCVDVKGVVNGLVAENTVTCPGCNVGIAGFYIENIYSPTASVTYRNNVAYGLSIGFQVESGGECASTQGGNCSITAKFYNNTVFNASFYSFIYSSYRSIDSFDIRNNIFSGAQFHLAGGTPVTETHNNCYNGASCSGSADLSVDPQYVSPGTGDFHLQSTSPVIGKGTNVGLPYNGTAPDLGAFQH